MKSQIIIHKKYVRLITQYGIHERVLTRLVYERNLLMYQVKVNMVCPYNRSVVSETLIHIIPEKTALLSHIVI
jgi:hypothetical protein